MNTYLLAALGSGGGGELAAACGVVRALGSHTPDWLALSGTQVHVRATYVRRGVVRGEERGKEGGKARRQRVPGHIARVLNRKL
jgi:hypothetical protein